MRAGALLSVVVVAGCNQLYGLNNATRSDAAQTLDADVAPVANIQVTPLIFDPTGKDPSTLMPTNGVQDGVGFGALPALTDTAWPTETFITEDGRGAFSVPYEIWNNAVYRITWTPADGVPVEAQGAFGDGSHLVSYVAYGAIGEKVPPPANAYLDNFTPPTSDWKTSRYMVFGSTWALHYSGVKFHLGSAIRYTLDPAALGRPMTSQLGGLYTPTANTLLMGIDGATGTSSTIYWTNSVTSFNAAGDPIPYSQTGYSTTSPLYESDPSGNVDFAIDSTLGMRGGDPDPTAYSLGVIPAASLPNFLQAGNLTKELIDASCPDFFCAENLEGGLSVPMFMPMAFGAVVRQSFPDVFDGTIAPKFTPAMLARAGVHRVLMINGMNVFFDEGVQVLTKAIRTADGTTTVSGPKGLLVTAMRLHDVDVYASGSNPVIVPKQPVLELKFDIDKTIANDCMVTLYEVAGTALVAKQRYLRSTQDTLAVLIDGAKLDSTKTYVVGFKCHLGYPQLATPDNKKDWSAIQYPFGEGAVYSLPFVAQ